jgi:Pyridoxamine 5'-phosphate oxidase
LGATIDRATICRYYIKSLRTGEQSAARQVAPHIADDAVAWYGGNSYQGRDAVLARMSGKWPMTNTLRRAGWSEPAAEDGHLVVTAEYPPGIAMPRIARVVFSFSDRDEITEVVHELVPFPDRLVTDEVPLVIRGLVNDALGNNTPLCLAYVNADGEPVLSLRGSLQFHGPRQISAWIRNPKGGLVAAIAANPKVALLYRDNDRLITMTIKGLAHIEPDEEIRGQVYDLMPEVEQTHDPARAGACLIIDIKSIQCLLSGAPITVEL